MGYFVHVQAVDARPPFGREWPGNEAIENTIVLHCCFAFYKQYTKSFPMVVLLTAPNLIVGQTIDIINRRWI